MSFLSALAGIDPLIAAAKRRDWRTALSEVVTLVERYAGRDAAKEFRTFLAPLYL